MTAARGTLHLGTSGFGYDAWKGSFYPEDIPAKDMLAFYARRFPSVEINYTFRSVPSAKTLAAWRDATPESFVFAFKAHMRICNVLRLERPGEGVEWFLGVLAPLGARAGPVLFQCPPKMEFDRARVERFLDAAPPRHRYVLEFHHPSWAEALPLLASRGVGWCIADTDELAAPDDALATGAFHYVRMRRTKYTAAQLAEWARRIDAALRAGRDVHCYFKHEDEGTGPRFAARLEAALAKCRRPAKSPRDV